MERVAARDARSRWAELLNRVYWRGERFVITRQGRTVAQLVPVDQDIEDSAAASQPDEHG